MKMMRTKKTCISWFRRAEVEHIPPVLAVQEKGSEVGVKGKPMCRKRISDIAVRAVLVITVTLAAGIPSYAGEGAWTLEFEPMYMSVYGHDPHVLTIHEIDSDPAFTLDNKTAVSLDTQSGPANRSRYQYTRGSWTWGFDFFWFTNPLSTPNRSAAADTGTIDEVVFEVADRIFPSTDPSEVLFYQVLEDNDLEVWTGDLYGTKVLTEKSRSSVRLQLGLRVGDFDNDYRAVVGIEDVVGSRLDASSNYERMMGPLVGLAGYVHWEKNQIEGYLGQSVIFGNAELTSMSRNFTGPYSENASFFSQEVFRKTQDVAIPITEFRVKWTFKVTKKISLGLGANTMAWWDVSVPPGINPIEGGDEVLHENTIIFFGLLAAVKITF